MRPVVWIQGKNQLTAVNPLEIAYVQGTGTTFTVFLRNGKQLSSCEAMATASEIIDRWESALREQP